MRTLFVLALTIVGISLNAQAETGPELNCSEYKIVELTLTRNGPDQGAPNSAWQYDKSVYIGWGSDEKEARANATDACTAAKFPIEACEMGGFVTLPARNAYIEQVKKFSG